MNDTEEGDARITQNTVSVSHEQKEGWFIYYTHNSYIAYSCCLSKQSVIFVCIQDFVGAPCVTSRYFPPSTLCTWSEHWPLYCSRQKGFLHRLRTCSEGQGPLPCVCTTTGQQTATIHARSGIRLSAQVNRWCEGRLATSDTGRHTQIHHKPLRKDFTSH